MVKLLCNFLMFTARLALKIRHFLFWSVIYSFCGLCACLVLLKLLWHIIRKPTRTFQWNIRENPPACLNDTSLGTHCYVRIKESGLRIHYVAAGERGKPLMLLLHGFPEFWYSWRYQLHEFKSEFRVVAVDLRGYGESDAPTGQENYKLDCLITDVKDIVESLVELITNWTYNTHGAIAEELKEQIVNSTKIGHFNPRLFEGHCCAQLVARFTNKGYKKCVLIGHDWGGMIAWCFAINYPEMVNKIVILNCPHPTAFCDYIGQHFTQLIKSSYFFFFQVPWLPELILTINDFKVLKYLFTSQSTGIRRKDCRMTADEIEAYLYIFSQPGAFTGPLSHYRNIFSSLPLNQNEVISPTLLLWGENEVFLEFGAAEATQAYVRNHFRLNIVPGASHWLQQDQPEVVNNLIWAFLKEEAK